MSHRIGPDDLIDSAARSLVAGSPRPSMMSSVLSAIESQGTRPARVRGWRLASAAAMVAVSAAVLVFVGTSIEQEEPGQPPPIEVPQAAVQVVLAASEDEPRIVSRRPFSIEAWKGAEMVRVAPVSIAPVRVESVEIGHVQVGIVHIEGPRLQ
jgi:hypothetical protein